MMLRAGNIEALLETELARIAVTHDEDGNTIKQTLMLEEHVFGEECEITQETLIEVAEYLTATRDVVFSFKFLPAEDMPWRGGIYKWHEPLAFPKNEEEAKELVGTEARKFEGRWLPEVPDVAVFDRDMPNLFCQLVTALAEMFDSTYAERTE